MQGGVAWLPGGLDLQAHPPLLYLVLYTMYSLNTTQPVLANGLHRVLV